MTTTHHNYSLDLVADLENDVLEEQDQSSTEPVGLCDATLIVLDTNASMFVPLPTDDDNVSTCIPFFMATLAVYEILKENAISNPRDYFGLLLYNTTQSNLVNSPGMFLYLPLEQPDPTAILSMLDLSKGNPYTNGTISSAPNPINPVTVFSEALHIFRGLKNKVGGKRLILITNQDVPFLDAQTTANMDKYMHSLKTRVSDLRHSQIHFSPYFIPPPTGLPFRLDRLWGNLLDDDDPVPSFKENDRLFSDSPFTCTPAALITVAPSYDILLEAMKRREAKQRPVFRVPFFVTEKLVLGVKGYLQYRTAPTRPSAITVLAETHEPVVRVSQLICPSTTGILNKDQIVSMYELGSTPVPIHPKRMATLRAWGKPSIRLLGFKHRSQLRQSHNLSHSTLLVPDEAQYKGSTTTFVCLLEQLHAQDLFALVQWYPRQGTTPRLAALIPQWEKFDEIGMVQPSALVAIPLPFKDELRKVEWPKNPILKEADDLYAHEPSQANQEKLDRCRDQIDGQVHWLATELLDPVIRKWRWAGFDPMERSNPSAARFRALLQSNALDQPIEPPTEVECGFAINAELWQSSGAKERAVLFNEQMGPLIKLAGTRASTAKPKVQGSGRPQFNPEDLMDSTKALALMRTTWESNRLIDCLVKDLKAFCTAAELPVSGTKDRIIERINKYFDNFQG